MKEKPNISIPIRSFDTNSVIFKRLTKLCNITYINTYKRRLSNIELYKALEGVDGVIAGTEPYGNELIGASSRLRVISRVGVGTDNIDQRAANEHGVTIINTPNAPVKAVAEHAIAMLLTALKRIHVYNENTHHGDFSIVQGSLLAGKVIGVLGMGRIGKRFASILTVFDCKILFYDPWFEGDIPIGWIRASSITDLLKSAEVISIHANLDKKETLIFNDSVFSQCRSGVVLINTARASCIDENALCRSLEQKIVSFACLDVLSEEPYDGPLLRFPQVLITPHVASNTVESRSMMETEAIENLIRYFEGEEL